MGMCFDLRNCGKLPGVYHCPQYRSGYERDKLIRQSKICMTQSKLMLLGSDYVTEPGLSKSKHQISFVEVLIVNKANLRDLIAATGLVILLKLDSNRLFFSRCDLEIWWMTKKNNRAPLLCYFKLFASFPSHWWIQTGVTVRKHLIWVKIDDFFSRVTLIFDGRPSKTIGHLFSATSSFVQHFVAIGEFKLELQSGNAQSGPKSTIFSGVGPSNLTDDLEKQ